MDTVFAAVNTATYDADDAAATEKVAATPTSVTPDAPAVTTIGWVAAATFTTVNSNEEPTPSSVNAAPSSAPVGVVKVRLAVGVMV